MLPIAGTTAVKQSHKPTQQPIYAQARWNPQWRPSATKPTVTGYLVYAYTGHPLLGEIHGTRQIVKTENEAKKIAHYYRHNIRLV